MRSSLSTVLSAVLSGIDRLPDPNAVVATVAFGIVCLTFGIVAVPCLAVYAVAGALASCYRRTPRALPTPAPLPTVPPVAVRLPEPQTVAADPVPSFVAVACEPVADLDLLHRIATAPLAAPLPLSAGYDNVGSKLGAPLSLPTGQQFPTVPTDYAPSGAFELSGADLPYDGFDSLALPTCDACGASGAEPAGDGAYCPSCYDVRSLRRPAPAAPARYPLPLAAAAPTDADFRSGFPFAPVCPPLPAVASAAADASEPTSCTPAALAALRACNDAADRVARESERVRPSEGASLPRRVALPTLPAPRLLLSYRPLSGAPLPCDSSAETVATAACPAVDATPAAPLSPVADRPEPVETMLNGLSWGELRKYGKDVLGVAIRKGEKRPAYTARILAAYGV